MEVSGAEGLQIRQQFAWFEEVKRWGDVTLDCRRLGISQKTFYKWLPPVHRDPRRKAGPPGPLAPAAPAAGWFRLILP